MKRWLPTLLIAGGALVMNSCGVNDEPVGPTAPEERTVLECMYVNGQLKDSLVYDNLGRVVHVENYSEVYGQGNLLLDRYDFEYSDQQVVIVHSTYDTLTGTYPKEDRQYLTLDKNGRVVKRELVAEKTQEVMHDYDEAYGYDDEGRLVYAIVKGEKIVFQWDGDEFAGHSHSGGATLTITPSEEKCTGYLPVYPSNTNDYLYPHGFYGKAPAHLPATRVLASQTMPSSTVSTFTYHMENGLMASYDFVSEMSSHGTTLKVKRTNSYKWKKILVKKQ